MESVGEKGQLNLSTSIPKPLLEQAEKGKHLQYIDISSPPDSDKPSGSSRSWVKLAAVLNTLQAILQKKDGKSTTRIVVHELGSADYDEAPIHVRPTQAP